MRKYTLPALISLLFVLWPTLTQAQDFEYIRYGEVVTGEVTPAISSMTYQFDGEAESTIYITMIATNEDFVPSLRLFDSEQNLLHVGEEYGSFAMLGPITLADSDPYIISVGKADWSDAFGVFEIWVNVVETHSISLNESYAGFLPSRLAVDFVTFYADERDVVAFNMFSEVQTSFTLVSPNGEQLLAEGGYANPNLGIYQIPQSGDYTVMLQSFEDNTEYAFAVSGVYAAALTTGVAITGEAESNNSVFFSFESQAGKVWDVNAQISTGNYRVIRIRQLQNRTYWDTELRYDEGSGPNGTPRITQFVAPEDGTYYVELVAFSDDLEAVHPFSVTLSPATLLNLVSGIAQTGTVSLETGELTYFYTGSEGESVRIDFSRLSETGVLGLRVLSPEDEVVTFVGRSARSASFDVILPITATYAFEIANDSYNAETPLDFSLIVTSAAK